MFVYLDDLKRIGAEFTPKQIVKKYFGKKIVIGELFLDGETVLTKAIITRDSRYSIILQVVGNDKEELREKAKTMMNSFERAVNMNLNGVRDKILERKKIYRARKYANFACCLAFAVASYFTVKSNFQWDFIVMWVVIAVCMVIVNCFKGFR